MKNKIFQKKGFTLVELMVSMSIFSIVMVICTGSILSILDSNRKSQTLRAVMDNVNLTLDSMTRNIRFGQNYHCSDDTPPTIDLPKDCVSGSNILNLKTSDGSQMKYRLSSGKIVQTISGVDSNITSNDVTVTNLTFYVFGSSTYTDGDNSQPKVIVVVSGYAGTKPSTQSAFTLETTLSQRKFDVQ